jgi:hypothetical protein
MQYVTKIFKYQGYFALYCISEIRKIHLWIFLKRWASRENRWIRSYWKGPNLATGIERQYRLKS